MAAPCDLFSLHSFETSTALNTHPKTMESRLQYQGLYRTRTLQPITTGTSVLAMKFSDGVVFAADTLGSYGSLARFRDVERLLAFNDNTLIGFTGDIADSQCIRNLLEQKVIDDRCLDDGHGLSSHSVHSWLTRMLYKRRTKFDPLWVNCLVGGVDDGEIYLGYVDKIGMAYEAATLATGFGGHIAKPMMRKAYEENPTMSLEEAKSVIMRCMRVLYYRDARSLNRFQIGYVTSTGVTIEPAQSVDTDWSVADMVTGYE